MTVSHVLGVLPVRDLDVSREFYERLLGVPPTNVPMPGILAEWRVTSNGWLQVSVDAERAGSAQANLAVDDLDAELAALRARGVEIDDIQHANKNVDLAPITDPDGNVITLIGNFREEY